LIGKTLRGELDAAAFIDVSAAVQRAIATDAVPSNKVRQLRPGWLPAMRTLVRPAAGLAIAASVAMATVVGVRILQQTVPATGPALVTVNPAPVTPLATQPVQVLTQTSGLSPQPKSVSPQLNNYLMRHSGVAGQATLQGVMPYARSVSFEQAGAP
jgi:negative regulator of sigma E activity